MKSTARELDIFEYFFRIKLHSERNVYGEESNLIEIQSNLFSVAQIIKEVENFLDCEIDCANGSQIDNLLDYLTTKQYDNKKINTDKITIVYEYNDHIIHCISEDELDQIYRFLRQYTENLHDAIMFENSILRLRTYVADLDEVFRNVLIEKVVVQSNIVNQCKESGIFSLKDLLTTKPSNLRYQEINEIYLQIQQIDVAKPKDVFDSWISCLKEQQFYVINKRHLGANLITLEEVGAQMNVTRERVRQIEKKAINTMLSSERNKYRSLLLKQLKLISSHKSFITVLELEQIGVNANIAIFLDRITGDIIYDNEYSACFFSRTSKSKLELCVEKLPNEFTKAELRDYCALITEETKGVFTEEEVFDLILRKCRLYGEYITKNKLTLKVVLSVLMQKYFPDGIDLYEDDNIQFLREKAVEEFDGFVLAENNRAIRGSLQRYCVLVQRGVWKYDTAQVLISNELRDLIIQYIEEYKSPVLPIQAIVDKFADQFREIEIYNKYSLHGQLKKILPSDYSVNRDYVFKSDERSFYDVVEAYIKQSVLPVTKRDIQENFPGITDVVIAQVAATTKVVNMNGYFVHLDNLNITNEEIDALKTLVGNELLDGSIHHSNAVFTKIKGALSGLFGRIGVTHYLQFYYLLHELFPTDYEYNRPFIATLGVEVISGEAQVINLIMQQGECNISDIKQYVREVGTTIDRYIEFVDRNNDAFIFKNRNRIITISAAGLDEVDFSGLDAVLSEFMGDQKYRLLSDFYNYRELPDLRCSWNTWSLYSIIKKYSQEFKLALTSNYLIEAKPILIRGEYNEQDIDLVALAELDSTDSKQLIENDDEMLDTFDYDDLE